MAFRHANKLGNSHTHGSRQGHYFDTYYTDLEADTAT